MDPFDLDDMMAREHPRSIDAIWERLDVLEEMVNFLYDRLNIVYEGETEDEQ